MEIIKRRGARKKTKVQERIAGTRTQDLTISRWRGKIPRGKQEEEERSDEQPKAEAADGTDVGDDDDESDCCYCRGQSLNVAPAFRPHMPHDREPAGRDEGLLRHDNAPLATLHSTAFPQCRRTVRAIACYGPFCHCSYLFSLWEHTKGSGAFQNRCFVCGRRAWHHRDGYSPLVFC